MRTTASVAVAIWVAVLLPYITAQAERKARSLLYTFKERETIVVVAVCDTPSGPKVAVRPIQFATAVQKWQSSSGTSGPSVTRITRRGCEPRHSRISSKSGVRLAFRRRSSIACGRRSCRAERISISSAQRRVRSSTLISITPLTLSTGVTQYRRERRLRR